MKREICCGDGRETGADSHPDAEEIYYVISGAGRLVMDGEEFRVSKGQTVYISVGVEHQSFNDGEEDLCYFYACSTAFGRASRRRKTGRGYSSLPGSGLPPAG